MTQPLSTPMPSITESFEPFDLADPFPFYVKARDEAPIFYSEELGYWIITRYEDIKAIFKDLDTFSSEITGKPLKPLTPIVAQILKEGGFTVYSGMSGRMPPDHTRIRSFINKAFTPKRISGLEAPIRRRAIEMIEQFRQNPAL